MTNDYRPTPLQTDHIELDDALLGILEILAENAHDIWARERILDGWSYGHERCDKSRQHPGLIPYPQLSEREKEYDRNDVLCTVRALLALGFSVVRPGVTAEP